MICSSNTRIQIEKNDKLNKFECLFEILGNNAICIVPPKLKAINGILKCHLNYNLIGKVDERKNEHGIQ